MSDCSSHLSFPIPFSVATVIALKDTETHLEMSIPRMVKDTIFMSTKLHFQLQRTPLFPLHWKEKMQWQVDLWLALTKIICKRIGSEVNFFTKLSMLFCCFVWFFFKKRRTRRKLCWYSEEWKKRMNNCRSELKVHAVRTFYLIILSS